jgi:hypothetical protein
MGLREFGQIETLLTLRFLWLMSKGAPLRRDWTEKDKITYLRPTYCSEVYIIKGLLLKSNLEHW